MPLNEWKKHIISVKNFPVSGIIFRDITPLLLNGKIFAQVITAFVQVIKKMDLRPDAIMSPEARGFIFGASIASHLGIGFVPARKISKLPRKVMTVSYSLEYGKEYLEIHSDALKTFKSIMIIDDLIATGGTISSCIKLAKISGIKVIGVMVLIDIFGNNWEKNKRRIEDYSGFFHSFIKY